MAISGMPGGMSISRATEADELADESVVGLLVSDRCQQLIRELVGDTDEHVDTTGARDDCLGCLRDGVMGATSTDP